MSAEQLIGFEDYIERNQLVPAKYARYHRLWVERWLAPTPTELSCAPWDLGAGHRRWLAYIRQTPSRRLPR